MNTTAPPAHLPPMVSPPALGLARAAERRSRGFSLVESVLALAVVAVSFISIFGLLPLGVTTFRGSTDRSVATWISQQLVNEIQQTDFDLLLSPQNPPQIRYYDVDGRELKSPTSGVPEGSIYEVNVRVLQSPMLPGTTLANQNLATVTIQVANNPGNQPLPCDAQNLWTAAPGVSMTSYSVVVSGLPASVATGN